MCRSRIFFVALVLAPLTTGPGRAGDPVKDLAAILVSGQEVWRHGDWKLKVYGIAHGRPTPCLELIEAAKGIAADRLAAVAQSMQHYSVGFLGIHEGRTSNFVFVDWWADENELHHHVYVSPKDQPEHLTYATPTGVIACVWDLRVLAFERQAWLDTVLKPAGNVNLDAYLERRLNEDA